jgi:glycosyltransferase involved in cell wall biosynthesis
MGAIRLGLLVDSDAYGGAEAYVRQLLRRLPAQFDRHLVVAEPVAPWFDDLDGHCASSTWVPVLRGRERVPELTRRLGQVGADVWHVNLVDPASNRAVLAAACAAAPTVATLHMPGTVPDGLGAPDGPYARVSAVVAVSAQIAELLHGRLGMPPERVVRVRNGVDLPTALVCSPPRSLPYRPPRVGAVGRLTGQKGFDVLTAAVALLIGRGRVVEVVVAGEGRDRRALEAGAAGLPIHFTGFVADVPAFLEGLDVFCLPSRREGLPLTLLEAMARGLPCVATRVGDIPEAVGDAAVTVRPEDPVALADALERLIAEPARRRRLGERARAVAVERFDAADMVDPVAGLLRAAATGPCAAPDHPRRSRTSPSTAPTDSS